MPGDGIGSTILLPHYFTTLLLYNFDETYCLDTMVHNARHLSRSSTR